MLGPSLLEMLHDLVFMEMLKLALFSVVVFFLVDVLAVFCVPNETVEWIDCSRESAF